jgi:hypothetical protein
MRRRRLIAAGAGAISTIATGAQGQPRQRRVGVFLEPTARDPRPQAG